MAGVLPLLVVAGAYLLATSGSATSAPVAPIGERGTVGKRSADGVGVVNIGTPTDRDAARWASYPRSLVYREGQSGSAWIELPADRPRKDYRIARGRILVRDPRTVATEEGWTLGDLASVVRLYAAAQAADPSWREWSKLPILSGPRANRFLGSYRLESPPAIARLAVWDDVRSPSGVLLLLPYLSSVQRRRLLTTARTTWNASDLADPVRFWPFTPDDWFGLSSLAAGDLATRYGFPNEGERYVRMYADVTGSQSGDLDHDPSTTPAQEALGWFRDLVVGPTATFLAAYGGGKTGGAGKGGGS